MSRKFRDKNKDLINLEVKTADEVWDKINKRNGKPTLKREYDYYGRIDKGTSVMITSTNLIGENHKYVDDVTSLPKNLKNKIVDMMKNKNKRVVYLVKEKKGVKQNDNK